MDNLAKTYHQQDSDKFESLLFLTKSLEEARNLNLELTNLLHLKNEEIVKNQGHIERLHAHIESLQKINQNLTCQVQEISWGAQQLENKINDLQKSTLWRITIPLRFLSKMTSKIATNTRNIPLKLKSSLRLVLIHSILYIRCRPKLKRFALKITSFFPGVNSRLLALVPKKTQAISEQPKSLFTNQAIDNLNSRAKTIYNQLINASENEPKDF